MTSTPSGPDAASAGNGGPGPLAQPRPVDQQIPGALVVVVEDDEAIAAAVAARLRADGHRVEVAGDGVSGVQLCRQLRPELLVLDLMLPGIDGWEVCRQVQAGSDLPVLMLTARDDETDVVVGLRVGADDYLTKPFSLRELSARVAALLRRARRSQVPAGVGSRTSTPLRLGEVSIDTVGRHVHRGAQLVHVTPTEFDLLVRLADRPGAVLTRERLLTDVWGWRDPAVTSSATRTVDTHVAALRRKLGDDVIRTVHGVGYAGGPA